MLTKKWLLKDFKDMNDYKKFEQDVIMEMREKQKPKKIFK